MAAAPVQAAPDVVIFALDDSPAITQVVDGLRQGLDRPNLPLLHAGGDLARGRDLLNRLAHEKPDLLVTLGTPALMLVAPRLKAGNIIFAQVADPYFTGAAYNPQRPEVHQSNITGLASPPLVPEALEQGRKLFPPYSRWGMIYNPNEGASLALSQLFANTARQQGLTPLVAAATKPANVPAALARLRDQGVQVIYLPPDRFAQSYGDRLLAQGRERRLLVVNGNPRLSAPGAILTVIPDYEALGRATAALARRVLAGEKPQAIPIATLTPLHLAVDETLLQAWSTYPPGHAPQQPSNPSLPLR